MLALQRYAYFPNKGMSILTINKHEAWRLQNILISLSDGKVELLIECIKKKCKEYFPLLLQNTETRAS